MERQRNANFFHNKIFSKYMSAAPIVTERNWFKRSEIVDVYRMLTISKQQVRPFVYFIDK